LISFWHQFPKPRDDGDTVCFENKERRLKKKTKKKMTKENKKKLLHKKYEWISFCD